MKILLFDLEYASCMNGCKIFEFAYVLIMKKLKPLKGTTLLVDAYNTIIELKEMLNKLGFSLIEMLDLCPNIKDKTENYIVSLIKQK